MAESRSVFLVDRSRHGIWTISGEPGAISPAIFKRFQVDLETIGDEIRASGPILARWLDPQQSNELAIQSMIHEVITLSSMLVENGISTLVFHTSSSHHIDTLIAEKACQLVGVSQIYLYFNAVNFRTLPLIQKRDISDRQPLGAIVSTCDAREDVERLVAGNQPVGQNPMVNPVFSSAWGYSQIMRQGLRSSLGRLRRHQFSTIEGHTDISELRRMRAQLGHVKRLRDSRFVLAQLIENDRKVHNSLLIGASKKSPMPVIFGHLQPEASTFPEGGRWHNHYEILIRIRQLGYDGPIAYKEHPRMGIISEGGSQTQAGLTRSSAYYRQLSSLGVIFLDPERIDPMSDSILPITITGSIALERALRGKGSVVLGFPWFRGIPGLTGWGAFGSQGSFHHANELAALELGNTISFVQKTVSHKTIIDATGIGSGKTLFSAETQETFRGEFNNLLDYLDERIQPHQSK